MLRVRIAMHKKNQVSIRDLRAHTKEIIDTVKRGSTEVLITSRGKVTAKIIPVKQSVTLKEDEAFGMWSDRKDMRDVKQYVDKLRKGRF